MLKLIKHKESIYFHFNIPVSLLMASSRRVATFRICIKKNRISQVTGRHATAGIFQKGMMSIVLFWN